MPISTPPAIRVSLAGRSHIAITGEDRHSFLQALISNDLDFLSGRRKALYACLLTPQGKFLFDFFVTDFDDRLVLETEAARADDLVRRLSMYKLRSHVSIEPIGPEAISAQALVGTDVLASLGLDQGPGDGRVLSQGTIVFADPRSPALGARLFGPEDEVEAFLADHAFAQGSFETYDRLRIEIGVPDSARDMEIERSTMLECNLDRFNGVSFDKGCFIGQELTARTHYRGLVKRRLTPLRSADETPLEPGLPVRAGEREVGRLRSVSGRLGLALMRVDLSEAEQNSLFAGEKKLEFVHPD